MPGLRLGGRPRPVTTMSPKLESHSKAYRRGWRDGRHGEPCCFTENRRLADLESPAERLDYYRGHRAGREANLQEGRLPDAS